MKLHTLPSKYIAVIKHPNGEMTEVAHRGPEEDENTPGTANWSDVSQIKIGTYLDNLNANRRYYVLGIERIDEETARVVLHPAWLSVMQERLSHRHVGSVVELLERGYWYHVNQEPEEEGDLYLVRYDPDEDASPDLRVDRKVPWPKDQTMVRIVHIDKS